MYAKLGSYLNPSSFLGQSRKRDIQNYDTNDKINDESNYSSSIRASTSETNDAPLRFIIIRHGERVDVMYGAGWTRKAFDYAGHYSPFDSNMPPSLPHRVNWSDYDIDTPLTAKGLSQSWNVGNVLAQYSLPVTTCYSSPAFRSIQTADRILEGMGRKGQHKFLLNSFQILMCILIIQDILQYDLNLVYSSVHLGMLDLRLILCLSKN